MRTLVSTLALLVAGSAGASPFQIVDEAILTPSEAPGYRSGMAAPTLVWDASSELYRIYFETEVLVAGCPEAFILGAASSPDGLSWSVEEPVFSPQAGTPWPCGARRPAAVEGPTGDLLLFFNVVDAQGDDRVGMMRLEPEATGAPSPTLTAVSQARAPEQRQSKVRERSRRERPVTKRAAVRVFPELEGLLDPTVAFHDGEWLLIGILNAPDAQDLVSARSVDLRTWSVDAHPAVPMGALGWAEEGTLSPSLTCRSLDSWGYELYHGGWAHQQSAWSWGVSDDGNTWYLTSPLDTWTDDSAWLSWDAVRANPATLVVFETLDDRGRSQIGLAADAPYWAPTDSTARRCQP